MSMPIVHLAQQLDRIAGEEEGEVFMGRPSRWFDEGRRWRCPNGHVSGFYLKSEARGGAVCLSCFEPVCLTFPEDVDGPLRPPQPA